MNFKETFEYLAKMREADPNISYWFVGDVLHVSREVWVQDGVPELFAQAREMFAPSDPY